MTRTTLLMYLAGVLTCFGLDLVWLGIVARGFYARQFGALMRPDIQWLPGVSFYLLYVSALLVFVAAPAVAQGGWQRAALFGAFFGLAAYAAFDLTGLALLRDFPKAAALVDMAWGATLSSVVCVTMYQVSRIA